LTTAAPAPQSAGRVRLLRDGPLASLILDNPGARNALTAAMYEQLHDACRSLAADPSVRLVVIRGQGETFAAGTDIADLLAVRTGADGIAYEGMITRVLNAVRALDVLVVGLVEGPAVGGGLAILACCDLVYASPQARFGAPVARTLGNCVSPATTARLRSALGRALATELLLTGRLISAAEAHAAGFVRAVVVATEFDGLVQDLVHQASRCAPMSVAAAKEFGRRLDNRADGVEHDDVFARVYGSSDFRDGVAAFLAHRPPAWSGS
jgi:enoyl-CoA hydratase/carnithine racemase